MDALQSVNLSPLMARTRGNPAIKVGLIDGPVFLEHPDLDGRQIQEMPSHYNSACLRPSSAACAHGTLVAGVLSARRGSAAPAICPLCTLLVRPIFPEASGMESDQPSARPAELGMAIEEVVRAGARVLNLSAAISQPSSRGESQLEEALNFAACRNVLVVAAAGNQGTLGSSSITRHQAVIPVVACDLQGWPTEESNLGKSIGQRGLRAPGRFITSLATDGTTREFEGTSAAAPIVSGTIALLWSEFPEATALEIKAAVLHSARGSRSAIVPPLLDAWGAYESLARQREYAMA